MLHMQAHEQAAAAKQNKPQNKVSQSISFKDMPPDGQTQMAAEVGIQLSPVELQAKQDQDRQDKAAALLAKKQPTGPVQ